MLQIRKSWKGSRESRSSIGDNVVSWFNELDRKPHTSIVLVVSAKSPNESISSHACKSSLQRSWSLVLCSDACDFMSGVSIVVDEEQRKCAVLCTSDWISRYTSNKL